MIAYIEFADRLSAWFGKAFAWLILVMTFGVCYEVFVRYGLNAPTAWAFDVSYICYGTLFMMAGAYTLSRNGHVRGTGRVWRVRANQMQRRKETHTNLFCTNYIFSGAQTPSRAMPLRSTWAVAATSARRASLVAGSSTRMRSAS